VDPTDRDQENIMTIHTAAKIAAGVAALAATASLTSAHAATTAPAPTATKIAAIYQAKTVNQHLILGPQSAPTTLARTAPLSAGTYLVTAAVAAVISSHDQIVCAAFPGGGNDGVFGTAGNPGTGSVYGTATITDTVTVTAGQSIPVVCNSFNYGLGTYAANAVLEAVPVQTVK
jgi:hypothetical protein